MTLDRLFEALWKDYSELNPQAQAIHQLLEARGEKIQNDHIAFRSFDDPKVNIDKMAKFFLQNGYKEAGDYHFEAKKLTAKHYEHSNPNYPKIFISELKTPLLSPESQALIQKLLDQIPEDLSDREDFLFCGRPWSVRLEDYEKLSQESEYAAWMSAFGFRANHFTVFVNSLKSFQSLNELNSFLKSHGFALNSSGGEIKGGPADSLEQSSTLAAQVDVPFEDSVAQIPSCYYEFAKRYPLPSGELYQGFVAASADKIFESTNRQSL